MKKGFGMLTKKGLGTDEIMWISFLLIAFLLVVMVIFKEVNIFG